MSSSGFGTAFRYGLKYLFYNVFLFGTYFIWIGFSAASIKSPMSLLNNLEMSAFSLILANVYLVSGLMGELFMIIADGVNHGTEKKQSFKKTGRSDKKLESSKDATKPSNSTGSGIKITGFVRSFIHAIKKIISYPLLALSNLIEFRTKKEFERLHDQTQDRSGETKDKSSSTNYSILEDEAVRVAFFGGLGLLLLMFLVRYAISKGII